MNPPKNARLLALALPLFVKAGAVNGTALVVARAGDDLYYLVDNVLPDGPPLWVHESEVERCFVGALPVEPREP
jgi:hypothetical protein